MAKRWAVPKGLQRACSFGQSLRCSGPSSPCLQRWQWSLSQGRGRKHLSAVIIRAAPSQSPPCPLPPSQAVHQSSLQRKVGSLLLHFNQAVITQNQSRLLSSQQKREQTVRPVQHFPEGPVLHSPFQNTLWRERPCAPAVLQSNATTLGSWK